MEFAIKVLVIAVLAIITLVILAALVQVLSGGSFDMLGGMFKWFKSLMP